MLIVIAILLFLILLATAPEFVGNLIGFSILLALGAAALFAAGLVFTSLGVI